jgi:hypothetical protein
MSEVVNIIEIHELAKVDDGKALILQLQDWGAIPKSLKCKKCSQLMSICKDKSAPTGWKWKCDKTIKVKGQKKNNRCRYGSSVTGGTLFDGNRMTLKDCCIFINLWLDNSRLDVIRKQVKRK